MASTGFWVPWPVSFLLCSMLHRVDWVLSPIQWPVPPFRTAYQQGSCCQWVLRTAMFFDYCPDGMDGCRLLNGEFMKWDSNGTLARFAESGWSRVKMSVSHCRIGGIQLRGISGFPWLYEYGYLCEFILLGLHFPCLFQYFFYRLKRSNVFHLGN